MPFVSGSSRLGILAIFILQAIACGGLFTRIPDVQAGLGLTEAQLGFALAAQPIGGFSSFLVSSYVVEHIGAKRVCLIGVPVLAFAAFLFAAAASVWVAVVGLLIFGMSFSLVNVAMNVEADRIEAANAIKIMGKCHGVWSIGFLLASLVGVAATGAKISAAMHLGLMSVLVSIGVIVLVLPLAEAPNRSHDGAEKSCLISWPTLATLGIVGFGLLGSVLQSGTQNWSVIYMRNSFALPDWVDALSIPVFLVMLTIGRLLGDNLLDRFGTYRVSQVLLGISLLGLGSVVFAPVFWIALLGFGLMGLGSSAIYPIMVSAAASLGDRPASANVAAVTMTTGIGMLIVSPVMGLVSDAFSVRFAFAALLPAFVLAYFSIKYVVPTGER